MRQDDQAFLESNREIIASLDHVPSPAALLDEDGTIRWQNQSSLELRGPRVGSQFDEFLAPDVRARARAFFAQIMSSDEAAELAVDALDAHGEYVSRQGRWRAVPTRDGGKVVVVLSLGDRPAAAETKPDARVPERLTPRQFEILRLLDAGRSTEEIASDLSLSATTVRNHITNLLAALGVHSRLQAVVIARKTGLLER